MSLDDVSMRLIDSLDEVDNFRRWLGERRDDGGAGAALGFDTETSGLDPRRDRVRLCQIGDRRTGWAFDWSRWSGVMWDTLNRWDGRWIGHNALFDVWMLRASGGVEMPRSRVIDTRVMAHIADPTYSTALKQCGKRYVDPRAANAQAELDEALSKKGGWTWGTIPVEFTPYWSYAALDTVLTVQLHDALRPIIDAHGAHQALEIETAVQWVTRAMEDRGVHVDVPYAVEHRDKFLAYCAEVKTWAKSTYGVDPGSNQAVINRLAEDGVIFDKRTKSGALALDKDVLEGIDHPLARAVLQRRKLQKIATTYLDHYATEVDVNDLIHPTINTLGARTSRMSMSNPNFQNLTRTSENNPVATVVRNCITARPLHTLVFCDFSQIEMRMLAWLSGDLNMTAAFTSDGDFFVNLARQVYRDDTIDKRHPLRQRVKNVGYADIYGAGIAKLALTAGITIEQARETADRFNSTFPGKKLFQDRTFAEAMRRKSGEGYAYAVCPLTGRRHPADPGREYALVNFMIQGAAASLFKMKLLELEAAGLGEWMILPVHDEIILDVPDEHVAEAVHVLQTVMNDPLIMAPVPIEAEVSYGHRWGEKRTWDYDEWRSA